jgi:hypothetical protein
MQENRDSAVASVSVGDSWRVDAHSATADYNDLSGPEDGTIARQCGANPRVDASRAAGKRRMQVRRLTEQRRAQAAAESKLFETKSQEVAEALGAQHAAARRQREERQRVASDIATQKNVMERIGRARVAWQREQTWQTAKDAAAIVAEQEAAQRQRLRWRVQSVSTHPYARSRRPQSAPAGGRPNLPRSQVPAHEGGAAQLEHSVVRYGSPRIIAGSYYNPLGRTLRTGFRPSAPCPPPVRSDGNRRVAADMVGTVGAVTGSATPLGKRLGQHRALQERANGQGERPRPRPPVTAEIAALLG